MAIPANFGTLEDVQLFTIGESWNTVFEKTKYLAYQTRYTENITTL